MACAYSVECVARFGVVFNDARSDRRMVRTETPTHGSFEVDIGSDHMAFQLFDACVRHFLYYMVHGAQHVLADMSAARPYVQATAFKNGFPRSANCGMAHQAWTAGMDTDDFFVFNPKRHERVEVGTIDRVVKRGFNIFRTTQYLAQFRHVRPLE